MPCPETAYVPVVPGAGRGDRGREGASGTTLPAPPTGGTDVPIIPGADHGRTWAAEGWRLAADDGGVTAVIGGRPVADVQVREEGSRVLLRFWISEPLPRDLPGELTRRVFEHPALRPRRAVAVALPHGESDVLQQLRMHVEETRTHVAGSTCLLEGHVR